MRTLLFLLFSVVSTNCGCADEPIPAPQHAQPKKQYQREERLEGTFWIDRWGQGRFGTEERFIDESNFPRLMGHQGKRILLKDALSDQDQVPGTPSVMEFMTVQRIPFPPERDILLRWLDKHDHPGDAPVNRIRSGQEATFEVQVANWESDEMLLHKHELHLWLTSRHPPGTYLNGINHSFGEFLNIRRQRGVLRDASYPANLFPRDSVFNSPPQNASDAPNSDALVRVKTGETFSWKVTISGWLPSEYEMFVTYHKFDQNENDSPKDRMTVLSNHLYLDVLTDEPRLNDLIELHVRQRDKTLLQPGQTVPLEIVFQNRSENDLTIYPGNADFFRKHVTWEQKLKLMKGAPDDLDLSDMLFCYGSDGRVLPLTSKVAGPMEIRIPVNGSFTLPVDAPAGTEVARAVFHNSSFTPKLNGESDPNRYVHGWHWSEHWQHPSVRTQVP